MRVIYIDIDSQRPDHLGCYGYGRGTSPNMDEVAASGVTFNQAYCASSPCVPSRASLISGRFGINHGALTHWGPGSQFRFPGLGHRYDQGAPLLPRHLRGHGYETVSFSSFADRHQAFWFCAGWSQMHSHTLKGGDENADEVNAAVLPWLAEHGAEDDYFLHLQYWDPHRPYHVDQRWVKEIGDTPPPEWPDAEAIAEHQSNYGPYTAAQLFPGLPPGESRFPLMPGQVADREDFKRFVDGYDGSTRFLDDQLGQVFDMLRRLGVWEETAIIISADHGEAMGEEAVYGDHTSAADAVHHIPLIVRWPGVTTEGPMRGSRVDGFVYNVDLQPTLCELLGAPIPPGWDGRSVASALRGETWQGREHLVWDHALYCCQRVVRTQDWLFRRTYHPGLFPFDPVALFDMREDPHQTRDVADDHAGVVAEMDHLLQEWWHEQVGHPGAGPDPMEEVIRDGPFRYVQPGPWIERLQAQGRDADAETIRSRAAGSGVR